MSNSFLPIASPSLSLYLSLHLLVCTKLYLYDIVLSSKICLLVMNANDQTLHLLQVERRRRVRSRDSGVELDWDSGFGLGCGLD